MPTITDIQTRIERSFYEAVRLRVVADGYTPDITTYSQDPSGFAQYQADLSQIKTDRGWAVEVFGMSNPEDKGYKNLARVVLYTDSFLPGEYGLDDSPFFELNINGNYNEVIPTQNITHQLFMNCSIVCDHTDQFRYLTSVVNSTLPLRGLLRYYDIPELGFFVENTAYLDISDPINGVLEKIYKYRVPDVVWTESTITEDKYSAIEVINFKLFSYLGVPGTPGFQDPYSETEIWIPETPFITYLTTQEGKVLATNVGDTITIK